jgi:antibiotic biosynthesis monooxygenase (ABM) superfamily enzyme
MSAPRHVRVVSLWIHPGQEDAFEAFEREAARLMARHGGRIDSAVRMSGGADAPYEVHLVSFPDLESAAAYADDPATRELRQRRDAIISRTVVLDGREVEPYRP